VAWTPTTFKARWSEFAPIDDALVQSALDEAAREVDERYFGARTDDAVGLRAAHRVAISPMGQQARLESDKGATTYGALYDEMARSVGGGAHAIGAWLP
jgi:hypothetical protein